MVEKPENPNAYPFEEWRGMTLRDYFAGHAMLSGELYCNSNSSYEQQAIERARSAYQYADAMLQARKDTNDTGR